MLVDRSRDPHKPVAVFHAFQQISGAKKLNAVASGIAQGLDEFGGDQRRDVMRLAIQHPRRLLCRQARGQLSD
jgi:hypothetical protein